TVSHPLRERAAGGPPQRVDEPAAVVTQSTADRSADAPSGADQREDAPAAADTGDRGSAGATALPEFTHRSARLEDVARTPVAVRIDALGFDARIIPKGTAADGQLDVPTDGSTVVWYRAGSVPGRAGSAVLAAHVDYDGRPGVFYALDRLSAGDTVEVDFDDGSTMTFEVEDNTKYNKEVLPIDELFTRNGDAVLTLITCGGQFNHTTRTYDSNTVVQAPLR
ncbi:MAG: class F sortase, partial [Actinobacteria bacterium]|nr:class F sortase [Actinomycetota bacterium]